MNHDGESVDCPSVSAQSGERNPQRENQAYAGNSHYDEDVGRNQSVEAQSSSLMDQNHMSNGWVHERTKGKHQKKCEAKHVRKCDERHETKSEVEHENKNEAENQ
jgi:hypothetical protein